MSQNTSSAVMQQRSEAHDSLDDFPTPPWATRALCEWLQSGPECMPLDLYSCREPAANRGYMVKPLMEYFGAVMPSDVHDYGAGYPVSDYLFPFDISQTDWTITNPPFRLAEQFIDRGLKNSNIGVAVLVRAAFVEGKGRFENLFSKTPPAYMLQFVERVAMVKGRIDPEISSATAYCWLVWIKNDRNTKLRWLKPCRKSLERESDYTAEAMQ